MLLVVLGVFVLVQVVVLGAPGRPLRAWTRRLVGADGDGTPRPGVFVAAIATGGVLRLLWVLWATRAPTGLRDPAEYLRIASDLGNGVLPRFGGIEHSAYWPPGYPAILAPFVTLGERTDWFSAAFAASLVNVVAGTATIWLTGLVAARWIGGSTRNLAAWAVALCPALIYWTSTAHTETAFTPLFLGAILLSGWALGRDDRWSWLLTGALVGAAFLVRSPAVIALAVPALAIRATRGRWQGSLRATGLVALGATVLLVPWGVRNGVQVGVWSPASTNNAAAACFGHHDDAQTLWEPGDLSPEIQQDCFGGSPFDDARLQEIYASTGGTEGAELGTPDEPRWYREAMVGAIGWAITHPLQEVPLSVGKIWQTWHTEGRVVDGARNYAEPGWAGRWHDGLGLLADLWLWIVGGLAVLGLVLVPRCRWALPVWVPIVLFTVAIVGGVAEPHYRYPVVPLVAVLAAGFVRREHLVAGP